MPKTGIRPYETKTRGRLWMAYYKRNGRQVVRRGFRTAYLAENWRSQAMADGVHTETTVTVEQWLTQWLDRHRQSIRPSTYERYEGSIRLWIVPYIGYLRLGALSHEHIEEMHQEALDAELSPYTIRRNHTPLRYALDTAVRDGLIPHNPASVVNLPSINKRAIEPFTYEEQLAFLAGNRGHRLYPVYYVALHTGLRLGEIMALRVGQDIDLETRSIHVRQTRRGKVSGPPKSRGSRRRVILGASTADILVDVLRDMRAGDLVFPWNTGYVTRSMPAACKRAGTKRVRFHDLRHTHASLLLAAGANIHAVSARLGHASVGFTLQVYGHLMPGMDEALADATDAVFGPGAITRLSRPHFDGSANLLSPPV